jgi:transposase
VQLKTILNRVEKQCSFVYGQVRLIEQPKLEIEIDVRARVNSRARCSGCGRKRPGYDTLWGIAVFLVYAMRRVNCGSCGVRVEKVPWGSGKRQLTDTYVPSGGDGRGVGTGPPVAHRHRVHWRG